VRAATTLGTEAAPSAPSAHVPMGCPPPSPRPVLQVVDAVAADLRAAEAAASEAGRQLQAARDARDSVLSQVCMDDSPAPPAAARALPHARLSACLAARTPCARPCPHTRAHKPTFPRIPCVLTCKPNSPQFPPKFPPPVADPQYRRAAWQLTAASAADQELALASTPWCYHTASGLSRPRCLPELQQKLQGNCGAPLKPTTKLWPAPPAAPALAAAALPGAPGAAALSATRLPRAPGAAAAGGPAAGSASAPAAASAGPGGPPRTLGQLLEDWQRLRAAAAQAAAVPPLAPHELAASLPRGLRETDAIWVHQVWGGRSSPCMSPPRRGGGVGAV